MPEAGVGTGQRLTLDLSGVEIPADKFLEGVEAFLDLLKEVARTVSGKPGSVRWVIGVRPGSALVDFEPRPKRATLAEIPVIIDAVESGIVATEKGAGQPPGFSDRAVGYAGDLAAILGGRDRDLDRVCVWRNGTADRITLRTVANADALSGVEFRDWGTIEGVLETITGRRGLEFVVKDAVTGRSTRCHFAAEILDDVTGAFMRRVSVSGVIRYRRNGEPVSIKVEEFTLLPRGEQLPDFEDVRGILEGAS